ncbi:pyridoxal phosphate-dependent aminotransferase [Actinokineospora sp.]|uniref:pyridoxal phosphate-dependent aminotransferase n=1 Tax=Actinokineospora sp. TaxID=1872133 RepID=UPI004037EBB4
MTGLGASPLSAVPAAVESDPPVRLHASENPYGASAAVHAALVRELPNINRYPDGTARALVDAIAEHHGVGGDQVSVGNGVDEIILLLVMALRRSTHPGLVTDATFQSYHASISAMRETATTCPLDGYRLPVAEIAAQLDNGAGFAFVCNPHNPTGTVLTGAELEFLAAAARGGSTLIVDEAYAEYAGAEFASALPLVAGDASVCVLRTFSKAYGLAGLRVGYVIGPPQLVAQIGHLRRALPYNVNRLAQTAAVAALADQDFVRRTTKLTVEIREWFGRELTALGLNCVPSNANFLLVEFGEDSSEVAAALLACGYHVRDTTGMGLPGHIRISIGTRGEMVTLRHEIADLLARRDELSPVA